MKHHHPSLGWENFKGPCPSTFS
jgi:hypothetical protein